MNSRRPYLLRALYEWICDNACTPFVLVDTRADGVLIPESLRGDTQVVMNLGPNAVRNLSMDADALAFDARFSGVPHHVHVPMRAVLAIYARENGEGMAFDAIDGDDSAAHDEAPDPDGDGPSPSGGGRPRLSVVK